MSFFGFNKLQPVKSKLKYAYFNQLNMYHSHNNGETYVCRNREHLSDYYLKELGYKDKSRFDAEQELSEFLKENESIVYKTTLG